MMRYIDHHIFELGGYFRFFKTLNRDTLRMPLSMNDRSGREGISCIRMTNDMAVRYMGPATMVGLEEYDVDVSVDDITVHITKTPLHVKYNIMFKVIIGGLFFKWAVAGEKDMNTGAYEKIFKEKCLTVAREYVKDDLSKYS